MPTTHKWIDVSATISNDMVHWPDDPPTQISKAEQIGIYNAVANVTKISSSAHVGTHIDAPLHFFANGADVASIDINALIGTATVIEILDGKSITLAEIEDKPIGHGDAV